MAPTFVCSLREEYMVLVASWLAALARRRKHTCVPQHLQLFLIQLSGVFLLLVHRIPLQQVGKCGELVLQLLDFLRPAVSTSVYTCLHSTICSP